MKVYRLSSVTERTWAAAIAFLLIFGMGVLFNILHVSFFAVCVYILVSAGLLLYVINICKAAIVPHPEDTILEVKLYFNTIIYLSEVESLEIVTVKTGPISFCRLLFKDAAGKVTAFVPTYYMACRIGQANTMAQELADAVGLSFSSAQ